jgi:hypothetical protein
MQRFVRCWRELTCDHSGGIRVLTRSSPRRGRQFALQQPLGHLLDHLIGGDEQRVRHGQAMIYYSDFDARQQSVGLEQR